MLRDVHRRGTSRRQEPDGVGSGINDDATLFEVRQDLPELRRVERRSDLLACFECGTKHEPLVPRVRNI